MKRVKILNRQGVQTHGAEFEDPTAWIAEQIALNSWGKPERWVRAMDEDVTGALETRQTTGELGETVTEYRLAAEYTIEIQDMTAEIAAAKVKADAYQADVAALDKFKGKNLTSSEIKQALELFLKILFNENSSLAAELVRFASKAK